jgi:acyl CoA:acetate/3-ketoacid CoA transferase
MYGKGIPGPINDKGLSDKPKAIKKMPNNFFFFLNKTKRPIEIDDINNKDMIKNIIKNIMKSTPIFKLLIKTNYINYTLLFNQKQKY